MPLTATNTREEQHLMSTSLAESLGIPAHLVINLNGRDVLSIDGMRSVAQQSGLYAGQAPIQWTNDGSTWVDVWLNESTPAAARCTIYRSDWQHPLTVVHTMREYLQGRPARGVAATMPAHMLAKATEALALRKAFPQLLGGVYSTDEMHTARDEREESNSSATLPASEPGRSNVSGDEDAAAESKPAKPAKPPRGAAVKDQRKTELVTLGKALRDDYGDEAAGELHAVLKEHKIDYDNITPKQMDNIRLAVASIRESYAVVDDDSGDTPTTGEHEPVSDDAGFEFT